MTRRLKPAPAIFINPLTDAYPVEIREMQKRAGKRHMREVHRRLREASAGVDDGVANLCDAVESALTENPRDPDLRALQKALKRYQDAAQEAADLMNDGDEDTDVDDDDDQYVAEALRD